MTERECAGAVGPRKATVGAEWRIPIFLLSTTLLSAPFWWFTRLGGHRLYISALMWAPGMAAILTLRLTRGDLKELGCRCPAPKWLLRAWGTQLAVATALIALLLVTRVATFPSPDFVATQIKKLWLPAGTPGWLVIGWYLILKITAGVIPTAASALGEELGWRGFLTVETQRRWGFTVSSIAVGGIWALWHMPLAWGRTPPLGILCFMVSVTAFGIVFGWFRLVSRSVWPAMMLHAAHNNLIDIHGSLLALPAEGTRQAIWIGEEGLGMALIAIAVAAGFWAYRRRAVDAWESRARHAR